MVSITPHIYEKEKCREIKRWKRNVDKYYSTTVLLPHILWAIEYASSGISMIGM